MSMYSNIALPDGLRMTEIRMSLLKAVQLCKNNPEIEEHLKDTLRLVDEKDASINNWKDVLFAVANQIT